jgi:hypothetical protein
MPRWTQNDPALWILPRVRTVRRGDGSLIEFCESVSPLLKYLMTYTGTSRVPGHQAQHRMKIYRLERLDDEANALSDCSEDLGSSSGLWKF